MSTAPTKPPPGPLMPGFGDAGPGCSLQQALVSRVGSSASSKVISRRPSLLKAGDEVIFGTHCERNASMFAPTEAPPRWLIHGKSCPSLQRLGVMKEKFGVVDMDLRSREPRLAGKGAFRHGSRRRAQSDDVGIAVGTVVDNRVKVDKRIVTSCVAVSWDGVLALICRADHGMAASRRRQGGVVTHVLHVTLPGQPLGGELRSDVLHGTWIDAARSLRDPARGDRRRGEVGENRAVRLVGRVGWLSGDEADVVVVAEVPGGVILRQ